MKIKALLPILVFLSGSSFCQTRFVKTAGSNNHERNYHLTALRSGSLVATGYTDDISGNKDDAFLVGYNKFGQVDWAFTFGDSGDDYSWDVIQADNGDLISVGNSSSFSTTYKVGTVSRLDSVGKVIWVTGVLSFSQPVEFYRVMETSSGHILATGLMGNSGGDELLVCKFTPKGKLLWSKQLGEAGNDEAMGMIETSNGDYLLVGLTNSSAGNGNSDFMTHLLDSSGTSIRGSLYGGKGSERLNSVVQVDSFFFYCGWTNSAGEGGHDIVLMKTDTLGQLKWTRTYGTTKNELAFNMLYDQSDSSLVIAGYTEAFSSSGSTSNRNTCLIKTDLDGRLIWGNSYGGNSRDGHWPTGLAQLSEEGYYVLGSSNTYGAGGYDLFMIKTDAKGDAACSQRDPSFKTDTVSWTRKSTNKVNSISLLSSTASLSGSKWNLRTGAQCCVLQKSTVSDQFLCPADSIRLEGDSLSGYAFNWRYKGSSVGTIRNLTLSFGAPGEYELVTRAPGSSCDVRRDTFLVTNDSMPDLKLDSAYSFCDNVDLLLFPDSSNARSVTYRSLLSGQVRRGVDSLIFDSDDSLLITIKSAKGCTFHDSLFIRAIEFPLFTLGNDTSLCPGDSLSIEIPQSWGYKWVDSINQRQRWGYPNKTYIATSINDICSYTDSIVIGAYSVDSYSLGPDQLVCPGTPACFEIQPKTYRNLNWGMGITGDTFCLDSGEVLVLIEDSNGCEQEADAMAEQYDLQDRLFAGDTIAFTDSAQLSPLGNWIAYAWSTGGTSRSVVVHTNGWYSLAVTDSNGCELVDSIYADQLTKTPGLTGNELAIYPVPAYDFFILKSPLKTNISCQVMSVDGKIHHSTILSGGEGRISVQSLKAGAYIVVVRQGGLVSHFILPIH